MHKRKIEKCSLKKKSNFQVQSNLFWRKKKQKVINKTTEVFNFIKKHQSRAQHKNKKISSFDSLMFLVFFAKIT